MALRSEKESRPAVVSSSLCFWSCKSEHICKRIAQCIICRKMVSLMISQSENPEVGATVRRHCYGGNCHFDKNLIHIIQDFNDLLNLDCD